MPRVAMVVLNWNRLADTLACLESLQRLEYPDETQAQAERGKCP